MAGIEEDRPEQRTAHMESILKKIERFLGSEFSPYQYGGEYRAPFKIKNLPGVATLFVSPQLEKGMNASVRLSLQGAEDILVVHQIENASIHEKAGEVTFSKKGESKNGTVSSISIKEGGKILMSLGSTNS